MSASFTTFTDRASTMTEYGIPVVPLPPRQKFPPPKGFPDLATTDMDIISGWLVPNGQPALANEDSNCACVAKSDGFWFHDIDNLKAVFDLIEKDTGHKLQEVQTLVVQSSGNNKRHIYFKQNDASRALGNFSFKTPDGAESFSVRGNNEYVVSPYSIHPDTGNEYEIINKADPIEAPIWLTNWLTTAKRSSIAREQQLASDDAVKIHEGGRDEFLFAEACKLRDTKVSKKAALAALRVVNAERCVPPMDDATVRIKVESAYTRDARKKQPVDAPYVEIKEQEAPTQKIEERPDISRVVLSGRLGEICEREMLDDFPVSYAWLALLTAASVLVPERPTTGGGDNLHNLYTALVGPVNCGKSQAIEWATQILRIQDDSKRYSEVKPGSAERLLKHMNHRAANNDLGPRVLMSLDEWKFFFDKAAIEGSVFPTLLTTGFYKRNTTILDSFGRPLMVPASFSWIGGIVTDSYDDCLSHVTSLGLHDRLLQGINPSNYSGFNYRPFDGQMIPADFEPQSVQIDKSVWECLKAWKKTNPQGTREAEIALRVAEICASFDGAPTLYAKDLGPHLILADEQRKLRAVLKPNIGETPDAQCAIKVENYLQAHGAAGEWIPVRSLMRDIHANRFGPNIFRRTLDGLNYLRVIDLGTLPAATGNHAGGRTAGAVRLVLE